ncbi:MAG: hypothetical protein HGA44_19265 [Cellulomonadaceae bacterium]|nr:hypothetical protein [Cellulomonadaceae bacterium]
MHERIGGIAAAEPGARVVRVAPVPGGGLTSANASLDTGYGVVATAWTLDGEAFTLTVTVPANTRALVELPDGVRAEIGSGTRTFTATIPAAPVAEAAPWSLDTPMSRFVADDAARDALLAVCAEVGFFFANGWTPGGRWRADTTVRQVLLMLGPDGIARIERAIEALNG